MKLMCFVVMLGVETGMDRNRQDDRHRSRRRQERTPTPVPPPSPPAQEEVAHLVTLVQNMMTMVQ